MTSSDNVSIKNIIKTIQDPQTPSDTLKRTLFEMFERQPDIFIEYIEDAALDPVKADKLNWNEGYFSSQCKLAQFNFSKERLIHLISVRDYLRQQGVKGFVPKNPIAVPEDAPEEKPQFQPSTNLQVFVNKGDLSLVRIALSMELNDIRLEATDLRQALDWTKCKVPELCEAYIEKAFSRGMVEDKNRWDKDYFFVQATYLDTSFTEERFLHMIKVREHLRQNNVPGFEPFVHSNTEKRVEPAHQPSPKSAQSGSKGSASSYPKEKEKEKETNLLLRPIVLIGEIIAAVVVMIIALGK